MTLGVAPVGAGQRGKLTERRTETATTIQELATLSKSIEEKSADALSIITALNEKIGNVDLGIRVWLKVTPLHAREYECGEHRDECDECNESCTRWRTALLLGWSDFGGQWSLKLRGASLRVKTDSDGNDCVEVFSAGEPWPLLEAGDWLCHKALPLVPKLLD